MILDWTNKRIFNFELSFLTNVHFFFFMVQNADRPKIILGMQKDKVYSNVKDFLKNTIFVVFFL